jgi:hypothetical protein
MEEMLAAGFWILVFKGTFPYFIQHQASRIQYLDQSGKKVRIHDLVIFCSGLPI